MTEFAQALADIVEHGDDAQAIQDQARAVGGCEHLIRLRGHVDTVDRLTGELEPRWSTDTLPDGVTHTRCNNRRASCCEPCSRLYQQDAWQQIVSGLAGGKGVPDTVADHPTLFMTLTAPSFGPVHTRVVNDNGQTVPCRARRDEADEVGGARPAHDLHEAARRGRPVSGPAVVPGLLGLPGAVLWNAHASELWRRTRIRIYRELAPWSASPNGSSNSRCRSSTSRSPNTKNAASCTPPAHPPRRRTATRCATSRDSLAAALPRHPTLATRWSCSPERSATRSHTSQSPTPSTSSERVKGRRPSRRESAQHP